MEKVVEAAPDHAIRDHAMLGGSSANRWANCTGSVFHLKTLPPQLPSEAAEQGTKAHEVAEVFMKNFLSYKVTGELEAIDRSSMDDDMVEHAQNYVQTIWKNVFDETITGKTYGLEDKFTLDEKLQMYGYIDMWSVYIDDRGKRVGVVVDFKYGYHKVPVEKNAQLAFYACAMREEAKRAGKDLDYVRGVIYQPRAGGEAYKETKFSAKQLDTWKRKFIKAAKTIFLDKKAVFKSGEWCRFCQAQPICVAYHKTLNSKTTLTLLEPKDTVLPSPERLPDDVIVKIATHASDIEDFLSACKHYAKERCMSENPLSGMKVVTGKSRRAWKENETDIQTALQAVGVADPCRMKLRGITEIEKELGKLHGPAAATKLMAEHTQMTKAPLLLVSETDERPAVKNTAASLLAPLK